MITSNIARAIARGKRQAIRTCISVRDNIEGVAAIEFAYLAPVLLVMLLGTIEVSRGISIDRRFGLVTSMVGDLVAREKTIAPSPAQSLFGIMKSAKSIMGAADSDTLKVRIMSVMALTTDTTRARSSGPTTAPRTRARRRVRHRPVSSRRRRTAAPTLCRPVSCPSTTASSSCSRSTSSSRCSRVGRPAQARAAPRTR